MNFIKSDDVAVQDVTYIAEDKLGDATMHGVMGSTGLFPTAVRISEASKTCGCACDKQQPGCLPRQAGCSGINMLGDGKWQEK